VIPVFDSGALIALERGSLEMMALAAEAIRRSATIHTSAGVVAQVWRDDPRQHGLAKLLRAGVLRAESLDVDVARRIGKSMRGTSRSDVVDAHVVQVARSVRGRVYTSDPNGIAALGPELEIVVV
jgi:hypothetical protein